MRTSWRLILPAVMVIATGCASPNGPSSRTRPEPPPMLGQAKTGTERVRLDQIQMMAAEDGAGRR